LIIDESEGRKYADLYGLKKTGFIGILLLAYKRKIISNIEKPLNAAINKGFWIDKKLLQKVLESAKKI
jgi:predicted nucleic acid-binding protein